MDKKEIQDYLTDSFNKGLLAGKIRTKKEFAEQIGVNPSSLSAAFRGNELYLTDNLVAKCRAYVDTLELDELFPSLRSSSRTTPQDTIPVLPTGARAGTLGDFAEGVRHYDCEHMISPIHGADYAIQVTGDSMTPEYPNGSQIIIKKIDETAFVEWGKVYVLDTPNGAIVKQVRKTDDPEVVECVSLNSAFQPFTISVKNILGWYRVLMCLSLK